MTDEREPTVESLLPYDQWTDEAMRQVMVRALAHAAANGLPGEHHFYLTFRTDHPGVVMPPRLRAQYPQEMTIVLQHQFWDLKMDEEAGLLSVGLSFGGVPSKLVIPVGAIVAFADPFVRYGMRFRPASAEAAPPESEPAAKPPAPVSDPKPEPEAAPEAPQVVSLDAFRRRSPPKT
ncbi:MAG TPA: ClpXP protease specificity-enhancing factor SspB [Acetobacteraceae bacterium]|nr:ClpXP protease specificity-enhancing factor SspB [Acetobacteraceae bacterium]